MPPDTHYRLLAGFAEAARKGDFAVLKALLADDAELVSDGGGIVPSFGKVLVGAARIAQLYFATFRRDARGELGAAGVSGNPGSSRTPALHLELVRMNGQWGLLRFIDGALESAHSVETDGQHITRIHVQRNPEKLQRLTQAPVAGAERVTTGGAATS